MYGVVTGIVTNNQDPDKLGRVRVRFPWLSGEDESWWARVAAPMAGPEHGAYFLPGVDDEVLVVFEHGDVRFPYVIGALWNDGAKPPETNEDGKNDRRVIVSRSGHRITLDDADGDERIEIVDTTGANSVVISSKDNSIEIAADGDVSIIAMGKLTLSGNGIELESKDAVSVQASAKVDVKANGQLTIKGSLVKIN